MTRLISVAPVLPEHRYSQAEITEAFLEVCLDGGSTHEALVRRLHASALVENRHLVLPLEQYAKLDTFAAANKPTTVSCSSTSASFANSSASPISV